MVKALENILAERTATVAIKTPDQRLRVFVSSTLQELAVERGVVRKAIERLRLIPVLFELGARAHPPRELYRAYLAQSHIFIGIYWQRYGWIPPGEEISGLEDEYRLSRHMPTLIYIKTPAAGREQSLSAMLDRIKAEDKACYKYFTTPEELEELITDDLVVLLSEHFESSLAAKGDPAHPLTVIRTNLPHELTPFIGRDQLLSSVCDLLQQESVRLVTLTGPGGVGKTRLALKAASLLLEHYQDGIWLVELAPLSDPALIVQSVADVFEVREEKGRALLQTVLDYLRERSLLLILDNCEHLIQSAAQLAVKILREAPAVQILATSRETLGITGERMWHLDPLSTPGLLEDLPLDQLLQYEAVRLFVDRAKAAKYDFDLTARNQLAVRQICAQLDGIPLAIELAAARVRVLTVEEIAARLENRFRLLVGNRTAVPRQQTLTALIEWSYVLLPEEERLLLQRLSVFSGGWTLLAAEAVCSGGAVDASTMLDLLTRLVDKSLVIAEDQDGCGRYHFLETIRLFCHVRLVEGGAVEEFTRKHAEYFLSVARQSYGELWGPKQDYWLKQLSADHDNLRAALDWMEQSPGQEERLLLMAGSLWRFWEIRGYFSEGRACLEGALAKNPNAPTYIRANALRGAGSLAHQLGDYQRAKALHEQSLAAFRQIGFQLGIARELDALGEIAQRQGDYPEAVKLHTESLNLRREIDDKEGIAVSLGHLGIIARDRGQYQLAGELLEESLSLSRGLEDKLMIARALNNLGLVAFYTCDYLCATGLFVEATSLYYELKDKMGISDALQNLGNVARDQGDLRRAVLLYGDSLSYKQELGDKYGSAQASASLAEAAFYQGRYPEAAELAMRSLTTFREMGVRRGVVFSLGLLAFITGFQGDYDQAQAFARECLELAIEIDAPRPKAYCQEILGLVAYAHGDLEEAKRLINIAIDIFKEIHDSRSVATAWVNMARVAYRQGDMKSAMEFLDQSLDMSSKVETSWTTSFALEIKGLIERSQGHLDQAWGLFTESLSISIEQDNQQGIANCLGAMAGMAALKNRESQAVSLFAAAQRVREAIGARMAVLDQAEYDHYVDLATQQLKEEEFQAAWSRGFALSIDQVVKELENL